MDVMLLSSAPSQDGHPGKAPAWMEGETWQCLKSHPENTEGRTWQSLEPPTAIDSPSIRDSLTQLTILGMGLLICTNQLLRLQRGWRKAPQPGQQEASWSCCGMPEHDGQPHTTSLPAGPATMQVEETGFAGTGSSYKPEKGGVTLWS